jgi:hypothetical protein
MTQSEADRMASRILTIGQPPRFMNMRKVDVPHALEKMSDPPMARRAGLKPRPCLAILRRRKDGGSART